MCGTRIHCVLVCSLLASSSFAAPVLVAVELPGEVERTHWVSLGHPTYEFMRGTAIAEVAESDLGELDDHGIEYRVIDTDPWSEEYFMVGRREAVPSSLPGTIIWVHDGACLIKIPPDGVGDLFALVLHPRPMRKAPLPVRFWEAMRTKNLPVRSIVWNPAIQALVDEVNTDSLTAYIRRLQDFETRLVLTDSSYAASQWLAETFGSYGCTIDLDSFYVSDVFEDYVGEGWERNVVATKEGTLDPSKLFLIGGHFDSMAWRSGYDTSLVCAPGADDNASGMAVTLEVARLLQGFSTDLSVQFVGFAAEEIGLRGSEAYAAEAAELDLDIRGVLNFDVVGYNDGGQMDYTTAYYNSSSSWLSRLVQLVGHIYVPALNSGDFGGIGGSDHESFEVHGFSAVSIFEDPVSPYMHYTTDTLETLSPEMYTSVAKLAVATIGILSESPSAVEGLAVHDVGNGTDLSVSWLPNPESDVVGYRVFWGTASEMYTDSIVVSGAETTTVVLIGLVPETAYFVAALAVDADEFESFAMPEVVGVPRVVPIPPTDVVATPIPEGIRLTWESTILDIVGYGVYRRINDATVYDTLASQIPDKIFTDAELSGANRYYYVINAFDTEGNVSALSAEAYGRPITLDQGILVVDETRNSSNPSDSLQDQFYRSILRGTTHTEFEYGSTDQKPVLADLVPYSSVLWHADDYSEGFSSEHVGDFAQYLDAGGNLWLVGWMPSMILGDTTGYPIDFSPGEFLYDYVGISHADLSSASDSVVGTIGLAGWPSLAVDPSKIPGPSWGGTLRYVEALTPVAQAEPIFTIDVTSEDSPFEGEVCGVRYLGDDFKTVFFGFPLYFMNESQARLVARKVMEEFGEPLSVQPVDVGMPETIVLYQNIPNPFPDRTTIKYHIPESGAVSLKVYNIAGRLVRTLVSDQVGEGIHNVVWEGTDIEGQSVGNGVYFYRLRFRDRTLSRKLVLIR